MNASEELMHKEKMLMHLQRKQESLVKLSNLLLRLNKHIISMAPHQRERTTGKLLIEATEMIETLIIEEVT